MLAYLFWHCARAEVAASTYESGLVAFHRSLLQSRPQGFLGSVIVALDRIPWLADRAGYADWYLVESSADLDTINRAAVTGAREAPHDSVAALAHDGIAGLYRVSRGRLRLAGDRIDETWLSKPPGERYAEFLARMDAGMGDFGCLWQRQMTLGPTPEFCLQNFAADATPSGTHPVRLVGRKVAQFGQV
ncbi:MAG TPA: hypothetical protein VKB41_15110 [Steroidobacteraceae bacterium]|nr:hypothetical protein [Steroidobacteraceae bacterium]